MTQLEFVSPFVNFHVVDHRSICRIHWHVAQLTDLLYKYIAQQTLNTPSFLYPLLLLLFLTMQPVVCSLYNLYLYVVSCHWFHWRSARMHEFGCKHLAISHILYTTVHLCFELWLFVLCIALCKNKKVLIDFYRSRSFR